MTSGLAIIASPRGLVETQNPGLSLRPSESQFAYEPELKVFHRQIQVQAAEKQLCLHLVRSAEEKPPSSFLFCMEAWTPLPLLTPPIRGGYGQDTPWKRVSGKRLLESAADAYLTLLCLMEFSRQEYWRG